MRCKHHIILDAVILELFSVGFGKEIEPCEPELSAVALFRHSVLIVNYRKSAYDVGRRRQESYLMTGDFEIELVLNQITVGST